MVRVECNSLVPCVQEDAYFTEKNNWSRRVSVERTNEKSALFELTLNSDSCAFIIKRRALLNSKS